jgi:hypothetical protein
MLPFVLSALLSASPLSPTIMKKPFQGVQTEVQVEDIAHFPPSPVEQPFNESLGALCTLNYIEEVNQAKTGKAPDVIDAFAEEQKLTAKQYQQVREYCKAYSNGAAFVVAAVITDATILDILTRSKIPTVPVHYTKGSQEK